jgi:hypothetical protein
MKKEGFVSTLLFECNTSVKKSALSLLTHCWLNRRHEDDEHVSNISDQAFEKKTSSLVWRATGG